MKQKEGFIFMTVQELKEIRKELGMTQKEFAGVLGVSRQFLGMCECGREPISYPLQQKITKLMEIKRMME